jgi:hypothetical protein
MTSINNTSKNFTTLEKNIYKELIDYKLSENDVNPDNIMLDVLLTIFGSKTENLNKKNNFILIKNIIDNENIYKIFVAKMMIAYYIFKERGLDNNLLKKIIINQIKIILPKIINTKLFLLYAINNIMKINNNNFIEKLKKHREKFIFGPKLLTSAKIPANKKLINNEKKKFINLIITQDIIDLFTDKTENNILQLFINKSLIDYIVNKKSLEESFDVIKELDAIIQSSTDFQDFKTKYHNYSKMSKNVIKNSNSRKFIEYYKSIGYNEKINKLIGINNNNNNNNSKNRNNNNFSLTTLFSSPSNI